MNNNITLILPKVYFGSIKKNFELFNLIEKASITHILTLSNENIDFINKNEYKLMNKFAYDHESFEIFEIFDDCFKFIDDATTFEHYLLINSPFESISITILVAYLMFHDKISLKEALNRINEKNNTKINDGFMRQLELFEEFNYDLSKKSLFKSKMLEFIAEKIQSGGNVKDFYLYQQIYKEDNRNFSSYKCKKCRYMLFTSENKLKHSKPEEEGRSIKPNYKKGLIESGECTKDIYIEPVNWLLDHIQELDGKIMCPKCNAKLGSYSWCGHLCSCGTWMVPAFQISESRVDYCKAI